MSKLLPLDQIQPIACFVGKVLLEHSHAHSLHIVCGCFHTMEAELNSWQRRCCLQSIKTFYCLALHRKSLPFLLDLHLGENADTFGRVWVLGDYSVLLSVNLREMESSFLIFDKMRSLWNFAKRVYFIISRGSFY